MSQTNDITKTARKVRRLLRNTLKPFDATNSGKILFDLFKEQLLKLNVILKIEDFEAIKDKFVDQDNKIEYTPALRRLKLHHDRGRYVWYMDKGDNESIFLSGVVRNQQLSEDNQLGFMLNSHKYLPIYSSFQDNKKGRVEGSLIGKLQQSHVDIRTLEAIKAQAIMLIKDQKPKNTSATFKYILNSYGSKIPDQLKNDLITHCIDSEGNFKLSQLYDLVEAYKFAPQGTKYYNSQFLSSNVKEALWTSESASFRINPEDQQAQLKRKLSQQINEKFRMVSQAFRFFDNDKDGVVNFSDFLISLENFTIFATKKELKSLFNHLDEGNKGYLKLEDFSALFAKRNSSTPIPEKTSNLKKSRQIGFISERRNVKLKSYENSPRQKDTQRSSESLEKAQVRSFDSQNLLKNGPKYVPKNKSFLSEIKRPLQRQNISQL
ncbi:unnamed protein product [Blepharisma stoltei]|uniref:EF-hand domain-containing protein n=1 Tax=Blepharisma stoltei TaxID=1481888 RepID=A0AAU9IRC5_9CILI|nr:unnamed protein product [Blepharisma stoltei]